MCWYSRGKGKELFLWQVLHIKNGIRLQRNIKRIEWKLQTLDAEFQVPAGMDELCSLYGWRFKAPQLQLEKRDYNVCSLSSSAEDESFRFPFCVPFVLYQFDAWNSTEVAVLLKMKTSSCYNFSCCFIYRIFWSPLRSWLAHTILTVHKASIKF